jgi:pyroglutamyl-peptidase
MKILLTGFNRFGNLESNPSQLVVEEMARRAETRQWAELVTEVLPTEFAGAGNRIAELIRRLRPDWIICLGVAQGIPGIHLERVALNLDDTEAPDNAGAAHQGKRIVEEGPLAYGSTLPLEEMVELLKRRGIPAAISNHAGTYVCNHVFYLARHEVQVLGCDARCGFMHLPGIAEMGGTNIHSKPGLRLERMFEAVECCIEFARKHRPKA